MPSQKERSKDKPKEDQSSKELANANLRQKHPVFPQICQLQSTVHSELLKDRDTAHRLYKEGKRL
jgi:hypothetical protein